MTRDEIPAYVSSLLDGRPVRWTNNPLQFDGVDNTLDAFYADNTRLLHDKVWHHRKELELAAGSPVMVIFHDTIGTKKFYPDVPVWSQK